MESIEVRQAARKTRHADVQQDNQRSVQSIADTTQNDSATLAATADSEAAALASVRKDKAASSKARAVAKKAPMNPFVKKAADAQAAKTAKKK